MTLHGLKTKLRPIKISDAPRFVKWVNDAEVGKMLAERTKKITLKEEKKWIRSLFDGKRKRTEKHFAIDAEGDVHIGSVGLFLDSRKKSAKIGILIGDKNYWGKGCGYDAMKIVLNFAFKRLKLHRVELTVYSFNKRAINLYKKTSFKFEGTKREHLFYKGKYYDELLMGILNKEWQREK